jgi:hypothetical protein
MVELLHHVVLDATKVTMNSSSYVSFSCDEVTTLNNQSWVSVLDMWFKIGKSCLHCCFWSVFLLVQI